MRARSLFVVLVSLAASNSHAASDRCTAADLPGDHIPVDTCDICPADQAPDATFKLLDKVADSAAVPARNDKLAALAKKAVDDAVAKGFDPGKTFQLSDFGSAGVSTGVAAILPEKQTPAQKADKDAIWLSQSIAAKASINLGHNIPIGTDGFYVKTGLAAGATFSVTTQNRYDQRLADLARNAPLNQLTIPFAARDAASLKPGEQVIIAGNGNVAVSAGAGYGYNVANIGVPGVSAGASADVSGTQVLSGGFTTTVSRQAGNMVQVTVSTTQGEDHSVDSRLFAGIAVNANAFASGLEIPLHTGLNVVDDATTAVLKAAAPEAQKIFSAQFATHNGSLTSNTDMQRYTFDLSRQQARKAYEDSLAGDFRAAADLASCAGSGVAFDQTVNDQLAKAYQQTKLSVSLLTYSVNSDSTDEVKAFHDAAGTRKFQIFGYDYDKRSFTGSSASVNVGVVHGETGEIGADGKSVYLTWKGQVEDKFWTSKGEMRDFVDVGKSMAGPDLNAQLELTKILNSGRSGMVLPSFLNYYGKTDVGLDLQISKSGIARIASTSEADMWSAFAAPRSDKPEWATAAGRAQLEAYEHSPAYQQNRGGSDSQSMKESCWDGSYKRTRTAIGKLQQLSQTSDETVRAQLLRDAAQTMGEDFTAGAALANMTGQNSRKVGFSIKNENVNYTWNQVGADSAIVGVK